MAKEIILKVGLEGTEETISNVQKLEQEIEKLNKQKQDLLSSPSISTGAFSKQLDEIDSQIGKLEKTYQSATGNAAKFEKAQKNLEGVAKTLSGSINLVSGTLATFGVKNEEVEKTLLRVQAASSFASGLKDLQEGFKALGGTFGGLTKIMMANPFVLIGTLVAGLIGYFGGFEAILGVVKNAAKALFDVLGFGSDDVQQINADFEELVKTQKEYVTTLENANRESERNIKLLTAQGAGAAQIAEEQLKIIDNNIKINELNKTFNKNLAELFNGISIAKDLQTTAQNNYNEAVQKEADLQTDAAVVQINTANEIADKRKQDYEDYKKNIENQLKLLKEAEQAKIVVTEEGSTERFNAELQSLTTIEMFQQKYATELGITQNGITILLQENIDKRIALEENYYKHVNKLSNNALETKKLTVSKEIDLKKLGTDAIAQIDNKTSETDAERRVREAIEAKKAVNAAIKYAEMGADALGQIGNLVFENKKSKLEKGSKEEEKVAKKQFQFNKALQLGLAVMDGYKAITASLAQSPVAIGPVPNPAGIASLAFAALTSGINIAKIASTKFEGGASASSSSAPTSPTPSLNTSGSITPTNFQPTALNTGASQQQTFGGGIGNMGGNVLRAYISETEITSTQVRLRNIRNASEL